MAETAKQLEIQVAGFNVKKIDTKAYGVTATNCFVKMKVGEKEVVTTSINGALDGQWDSTFSFPIEDEAKTKCFVTFHMGVEGKQIGDAQEYLLPLLTKDSPVYKGLIVPGGKVDMHFKAVGFGEPPKEVDVDGFLDVLDGGMEMD
mmetsp:Transcript_26055/g.56884  ORF Transcript_26055/g.56884 Transcript_26055/m.56884 type:complete len:146 (+) Transcript_26055:111-548(+)|eukprot:CAMPEP_0202899550 /NCGR_PEP_ID=MMETSP1392-20130828/7747_1 /ASSEMBLY_ACC=CAM_ASM_000868 /TAXON_ID=225041 /ORGANISM="Chlamydomonas chlamydogama, Strain SAG 11-48b" /LENGTH=145 /DNA_ID=CAMNT_0049585751 /DNA_START=130 /DNA_END=567 /DNA_ORIENTATION=+